ncbi:TOBE domain-containing protein [Deinococcus lacus]|uniref:TOBE domain-containing protein n=1 Tax=Deinococcus lacus TaxID=392561 RepID=A0ABW1YBZ6_9DEIO
MANFLGRANLVSGLAEGGAAQTVLGRIPLTRAAVGSAVLCLRPEQLRLVAGPADPASAGAEVIQREFGGATVTYTVRLKEGQPKELLVREPASGTLWAEGSQVQVQVQGAGHPLP